MASGTEVINQKCKVLPNQFNFQGSRPFKLALQRTVGWMSSQLLVFSTTSETSTSHQCLLEDERAVPLKLVWCQMCKVWSPEQHKSKRYLWVSELGLASPKDNTKWVPWSSHSPTHPRATRHHWHSLPSWQWPPLKHYTVYVPGTLTRLLLKF